MAPTELYPYLHTLSLSVAPPMSAAQSDGCLLRDVQDAFPHGLSIFLRPRGSGALLAGLSRPDGALAAGAPRRAPAGSGLRNTGRRSRRRGPEIGRAHV